MQQNDNVGLFESILKDFDENCILQDFPSLSVPILKWSFFILLKEEETLMVRLSKLSK